MTTYIEIAWQDAVNFMAVYDDTWPAAAAAHARRLSAAQKHEELQRWHCLMEMMGELYLSGTQH